MGPKAGSNPYVGPRPFETGEPLFGRDRELRELLYLLSGERIVLVHSPSGAGKSSLIQAGLIPRLRARFDVWRPTRVGRHTSKRSRSRGIRPAWISELLPAPEGECSSTIRSPLSR